MCVAQVALIRHAKTKKSNISPNYYYVYLYMFQLCNVCKIEYELQLRKQSPTQRILNGSIIMIYIWLKETENCNEKSLVFKLLMSKD